MHFLIFVYFTLVLLTVIFVFLSFAKEKNSFAWYVKFLQTSDAFVKKLYIKAFDFIFWFANKNIKSIFAIIVAYILDDLSKIAKFFESISRRASIKLLKKSEKKIKDRESHYLRTIHNHKKQIRQNSI